MTIGLIDVDGHNFPNLALMKISAWHKSHGHTVDWWNGFQHYDIVYVARVFDDTYSHWDDTVIKAGVIYYGGTGFDLAMELPTVVEHMYPDYSIYPALTADTAYGFLTRGCPRNCPFCIVSRKEGCRSSKVADISDFRRGQQEIKLLDPNLLACTDHMDLLRQLAESGARVDFTQGLDIRLINEDNVAMLNKIKTKLLHFAWDFPEQDLTEDFRRFNRLSRIKDPAKRIVYVLTNYGSTLEQDLYRIYTLRELGYDPYVMIYDKPNAPQATRYLQRWCNNRRIYKTVPDFRDYDPRKG